jgi:hypothetical protein
MLRALRKPSVARWLLFGTTLIACSYTQAFTLVVVAALGIWAVVQRPFNRSLIAVLVVAAATFLPWYQRIGVHGTKTNWLVQPDISLPDCLHQVYKAVSRSIVELQMPGTVANDVLPAVIWTILVAAICIQVSKVRWQGWTLALSLFVVPCTALTVYAVQHHLAITTVDRYYIPTFIGAVLLLGGALPACSKIANRALRTAASAALAAAFVLSAASCMRFCHNPTWHDRNIGIVRLAAEINKFEKPVVVVKGNALDVVGLAQALRPEASIYLMGSRDSTDPLPDVPVDYWLVTQSTNAIQGQFMRHNSDSM